MAAMLLILIGCRGAVEAGKDGAMAKINPDLVRLYDEYASYLALRGGAAFQPSNALMRVIEGRVVIDAVASGDVDSLRADLAALGMQQAVAYGRVVSGQLPIPAIKSLAGLVTLKFAQPAAALLQGGPGGSQPGQVPRSSVR